MVPKTVPLIIPPPFPLSLLFLKAPYANCSSGGVREFSAPNLSKFTRQKSSENTRSLLLADEPDGSSQETDACNESGIGNRGSCYGGTEASARCDESTNRSNAAAADGGLNHHFKCHTCLEFFPHKSALSVHYNSAAHIQKIRAGSTRDSSTPVLTYPYVSTKPYQCDVCHVSYFYAFGLESHLKSVLHQSRTRKAGYVAANSKTNTETGMAAANLAGNVVANATQIAGAKSCNCVPQAEKVHLQPPPSLLPTPVVSAQAMPTVLPLLTLAPNSVPHAIVPSVFPPPGTSTTQLIPQPQMLMPLLVKGLQTQSVSPDGPRQILQQAVPVLGLCSAQQAQGRASSDSQSHPEATGVSSASRIPSETRTETVGGVGVRVKIEIKEEPCHREGSRVTPCTADAITQVDLKQEYSGMWEGIEDSMVCGGKQHGKAKGLRGGRDSKRQLKASNKASSFHVTKSSPTTRKPSDANLVLTPSNTRPCSSSSSEPRVLTEFQSQVLWAFFESRNEADSEIPPREDCEALGREVGLTEDEVRRWLTDTHRTKEGRRADVQSHRERRGSTEDEDDEGALLIDESGGTVLRSTTDFLSDEEDGDDEQITVDKKRKRAMEKEDSEEEEECPSPS